MVKEESKFYYDFYFGNHFLKRFLSYKKALKFATSQNKIWIVKKVRKRKLSTKEKE